ncbi:hypothetical protein [Aliiglaciecola lipolytica]|uniref:hypothetical protein n=1 Tax=Aliiglaciecola lipolytica TaxID=477689 RepID=UPI001C0916C4|nr:hypothetical protein [Aliiglaciecola lipolytica]MBU2880312.1 hypothetical protein [Aliiglaciecola lipolytica]
MANWIAGYWFAHKLGLKFAHIPFSNSKWEAFLNFGYNEKNVNELVNSGFKKVYLPLFDEFNQSELAMIQKLIDSYVGCGVIFIAEQDQFYQDQIGVISDIKNKYHNAEIRSEDKLIFSKNAFNIAIHVRRGDIVIEKNQQNENLSMRWQNNDYFTNVLERALINIKTHKPIIIYLFSQGKPEDFNDFNRFRNVNLCLDMNAIDSFLHMVNADLLITSKSSFSYKPALLSNGIKISPSSFWHGYPKSEKWILADENGEFKDELLRTVFK